MLNADPDESFVNFPTLNISEDLVPSTPAKHSQTVTLDFNGLLNPPLLLQTDVTQCGGQLWPGGTVLTEYLLAGEKMSELVGKTMFVVRSTVYFCFSEFGSLGVELGAGSGLVSMAIALRLRQTGISNDIHITDGLDILLPLIQHNISLNRTNFLPSTTVLPAKLSWGEPLPGNIPYQPDIVLAADCCYIEESFPLLLKTMQDLIGEETVCYFCYKKRRKADREMVRMLKKAFEVVEVEGVWQREGMFVYEIRRKQKRETKFKGAPFRQDQTVSWERKGNQDAPEE